MISLRHIIRASTNEVEYVGFDLPGLDGGRYMYGLPNFHPSVPRVEGRVMYNEGRAEIIATTGRAGCRGDRLDVSAYFPINRIATNLPAAVRYQERLVPPIGPNVLIPHVTSAAHVRGGLLPLAYEVFSGTKPVAFVWKVVLSLQTNAMWRLPL